MKKTGNGAAMKRERVPQAERRRITRGKLLDATIDSLVDLGYARTTTVEVGERTGLSRGTQLHHFPSKADLLVAAIEHLAEERSKEFEVELEARFEKGYVGAPEPGHPILINVYAGHLVSNFGEHSSLHQTDVAATKDADFHGFFALTSVRAGYFRIVTLLRRQGLWWHPLTETDRTVPMG